MRGRRRLSLSLSWHGRGRGLQLGGRGSAERRVQKHVDLCLETLFFFGRALDGAGVLCVHGGDAFIALAECLEFVFVPLDPLRRV